MSRKPNEPGKHIEIFWEDDPDSEAVYGHVDSATFAAGLLRAGYEDIPTGPLEHVWLRHNPDPSGEYSTIIAEVPAHQRGAFRATVRRWLT